jgi:hypothetical protein
MPDATQTPENLLPQRAQYVRHGIGMGIVSINPDPAHPAVRLVLRDLSGNRAFAEFQVTARPGDVVEAGDRRLTITSVAAPSADSSEGDGEGGAGRSEAVGHIAFRDEPVAGAGGAVGTAGAES